MTTADRSSAVAGADTAAAARLLPRDGRSPSLDGLTELASRLLSVEGEPVAVQVSLLTEVQTVPAGTGLPPGTVGGRSDVVASLCAVTVRERAPLVVPDARGDARVEQLAPVTSGAVGAYLGVPLAAGSGHVAGALCAYTPRPRAWSDRDVRLLEELARAVMTQLELDALAAQLRTGELRWDLARAAAGLGSFDLDLRTGRLEWDDRMLELFAYEVDEFVPHVDGSLERVHPDDRAQVEASIRAALSSCGDYFAEFRVVLPSGATRWLSARGRAFAGPDGSAERLIGTTHDVTEVRSARDEAARLVETMTVGFIALDRTWTVTYLNAEGARVVGRAADDVVGRTLWEAFPDVAGTAFEGAYRRADATRETVQVEAFYPHLDGWFDVRVVPTGDGLVAYFHDVTLEHRQRERASAATERLALLERVSTALADAGLDVEGAFARLAEVVVPVLADWSLVSFVEAGRLRDVGWDHADPALRPVVDAYVAHRLIGRKDLGPVQQSFETGEAVHVESGLTEQVVPTLGHPEAVRRLVELAPESVVVVPLLGRNQLIGALTLLRGPDRPVATAEEVAVAREVGVRAGLALDNARLYTEQRRLAEELQRSLLTTPPEPSSCRIAVRYVAAAEVASVGGDWYDAFSVPDGDVVLVIGDVMGHDTTAAAAMGQIRGVLRGIAWHGDGDPAAILTGLDVALAGLGMSTTATAAVARLVRTGPDRYALRWSSAGHPWPVVVRVDGGVELLSGASTDLLLGIDPALPRHQAEISVQPGDTLLLYTDGLIERRGQDLDAGLALLVDALRGLVGVPLEELCDRLLEELLEERAEDDVAVVAVRIAADG